MGLANDDFRKFINDAPATPAQRKPKSKAKSKSKKSSGRPGVGNAQADGDASKYRDRADERRRGLIVEDHSSAYLTAEQTKYLGGSIDNTHLVRGLDRLLLNRVKGAAEEDSDLHGTAGAQRGAERGRAGPAPGAASELPKQFKTRLGEAVANILLQPPRSNVAELFKPRRMAFVYFGDEEDDDEEDDDDEEAGEGAGGGGPADRGVWSIPETLMRSKTECPEPPECLAAAMDNAVLREVVGVMRAVKVETKRGGKDRKKGKDAAEAAEMAQAKQKHITQLKILENPQLAEQLAADAARAAARTAGNAAHTATGTGAPGKVGRPGPPKPKASDSGSGLFDDVGDDYEVNTSSLEQKRNAAKAGGYFGKKDTMQDLPAVAQHGSALGNDAHAPLAPAPAGPQHWHGGYDQHGNAQHQQYGYDAYHGYYDAYGNWVPYAPGSYYPQGYDGHQHGAAQQWPGAPQAGPGPSAEANKGKGFTAKMGDRAIVKRKFTTEQRKVVEGGKEGKEGLLDTIDDGDEYGAAAAAGVADAGAVDEEDDVRAMDSRERVLNRADFNTDEEFHAYKSNREAGTKAGFQFGVKVVDGRRKGKDLDRKLTSQMSQMRGMNFQRDGKAVDFSRFDNAFQASGGDVGATPSRKKPRVQGV